jgi:sucrose phosphorylase
MRSPISNTVRSRLRDHLTCLYETSVASDVHRRLVERLEREVLAVPAGKGASRRRPLSEKTAVLITYGDQVRESGVAPLRTLTDVADETVRGLITDLHILPFFPYSSDDGFSVIDYELVDPALGDWSDIAWLCEHFGLMSDLVINHVSTENRWFQGFVRGEPEYADYFITVEGDVDLSSVVRPRALPLLTEVETASGRKHVWTTFSADQVDLNYANPEVLLRMIDVLLSYVRRGATLIRLDAVAFLWKRIGSPCIHCEETHRIVKLMRAVLDIVAPEVLLITETNVPHDENISYFGNGSDEAQMVYQFPLPPLVVDAFYQGSAASLLEWAETVDPPPGDATFFNFLASHDGIGLRPLEGLVPPSRVDEMIERTLQHGGRVSYMQDTDGRETAYELNISFFDALSDPGGDEPVDRQVRKFLTAQAIMLALDGVPGIYFHSLFGSRSWPEGIDVRGSHRAINREKLDRAALMHDLADADSLRSKVFTGYRTLLRARSGCAAFRPGAPQRILRIDDRVFALLRGGTDGPRVLCLHSLSPETVTVALDAESVGLRTETGVTDLLAPTDADCAGQWALPPYETAWLMEAAG